MGLFSDITPGLFAGIAKAFAPEEMAGLDAIWTNAALAFASDKTGVPFDVLKEDVACRPVPLAGLAGSRGGWATLAALYFAPDDTLPTEH